MGHRALWSTKKLQTCAVWARLLRCFHFVLERLTFLWNARMSFWTFAKHFLKKLREEYETLGTEIKNKSNKNSRFEFWFLSVNSVLLVLLCCFRVFEYSTLLLLSTGFSVSDGLETALIWSGCKYKEKHTQLLKMHSQQSNKISNW